MGMFKTFKIMKSALDYDDFADSYNDVMQSIRDNPKEIYDLVMPVTITNFVNDSFKQIENNNNVEYGMINEYKQGDTICCIFFKYQDIIEIFSQAKENYGTIQEASESLIKLLLKGDICELSEFLSTCMEKSDKNYCGANSSENKIMRGVVNSKELTYDFIREAILTDDNSSLADFLLNIANDKEQNEKIKVNAIKILLDIYKKIALEEKSNNKPKKQKKAYSKPEIIDISDIYSKFKKDLDNN